MPKGIFENWRQKQKAKQSEEAGSRTDVPSWDSKRGGYGPHTKVIKIAMPAAERPMWGAFEGVVDIAKQPPLRHPDSPISYYMWLEVKRSSLLHKARNDLVDPRGSQEPDTWFDYVMFIDSDMVWKTEWIIQLANFNLPVIGGLCVRKGHPYKPTIFVPHPKEPDRLTVPMLNPDWFRQMEKSIEGLATKKERDLARVMRVSGIGTGFTMIRRDVLDTIKPPWFFYDIRAKREGEKNYEALDNMRGEDVYFCRECEKADIPVYCDLGMWVGHEGTYSYDIRDHFAAVEERGAELQKAGFDPDSVEATPLPSERVKSSESEPVQQPGEVAGKG